MKNICKFILIALCMLLVFSSVIMVSAEEYEFSGIVSKRVKVSDTGDVKVLIDLAGNPGITALKLWVSYDTNLLTVKENGINDTGLLTGKIQNTFIEGEFPVSWQDSGKDAVNNYKNGTIAEIDFQMNENYFGTAYVTVKVEFAQSFINGKFVSAPDMQGGVIAVSKDKIAIKDGVLSANNLQGETLVLASYDEYRMMDCKVYPSSTGNKQIRIADVVNTNGATKVKAFLWNNLEGLIPVSDCKEGF